MKTNKLQFLGGLGQPSKQERDLVSPHFDLINIDWNYPEKTKIKKCKTLIGFSMGAVLACDYATKHKVDTLILCSLTPGIETLKDVKANHVIFIVGEKEEWVQDEIIRVMKTLKCPCSCIMVPKGTHKVNKKYLKTILSVI